MLYRLVTEIQNFGVRGEQQRRQTLWPFSLHERLNFKLKRIVRRQSSSFIMQHPSRANALLYPCGVTRDALQRLLPPTSRDRRIPESLGTLKSLKVPKERDAAAAPPQASHRPPR